MHAHSRTLSALSNAAMGAEYACNFLYRRSCAFRVGGLKCVWSPTPRCMVHCIELHECAALSAGYASLVSASTFTLKRAPYTDPCMRHNIQRTPSTS